MADSTSETAEILPRKKGGGILRRKSRDMTQTAPIERSPSREDGGIVPEITTSPVVDDEESSKVATASATEVLKDEQYVERLAGSLSRRLEKSRSKIMKRTSELSLIKASPDSKNPSVILSCASDDEEDDDKKATPVRDSLSADQPASTGRLFRGLRRKLSKSQEEKTDIQKTVKEKSKTVGDSSGSKGTTEGGAGGAGLEDDALSSGASSSPSPPGSEYGSLGSHRGSWSTLLHAIGTAEMVSKVQRNAHEIKHERDIETLKRELEVHVSGNYQIKFGPVLPIWQAVLVFILNIFLPGFGTILSALFLVSGHTFRTAEVKAKYAIPEHFGIVFVIGLSQMMTITFLLIGWIWALVWGSWLIQLSMEHRKLVYREKLIETHEQSGAVGARLSIQVTRPNDPASDQEPQQPVLIHG